MASST